jgi:MFS transporter, DHA1 family, inner membrane transport protein
MSGGFTVGQRVAVLVVGVVGVLIPGLQPQLLGALAVEDRVSESLLGHVATAELLAMGIAAGGAGFILPITRLRTTAIAAILIVALLDALTPGLGGAALVAIRTATGLAEGVLIWIAIGLIVRAAEPARWSGIYLATQTLAQFAVATVLGLYVIPEAGSIGGFRALGVATALGLLAVPWLPRGYAPLARHTPDAAAPIPARGFVALASVLIYLAFVVAVWVYIEPLARERSIPAGTIAAIAPLSLAMQVIGAGFATVLAGRLPALPTLIAVGAANMLLLGMLGRPPSANVFLAATSAFGFLWLFAMPFQVPAVIAADPSRRAAALIGGAQLVGSSLGPFTAALLVGGGAVGSVLWFGAASIVVALLLLSVAAARRRVQTLAV